MLYTTQFRRCRRSSEWRLRLLSLLESPLRFLLLLSLSVLDEDLESLDSLPHGFSTVDDCVLALGLPIFL